MFLYFRNVKIPLRFLFFFFFSRLCVAWKRWRRFFPLFDRGFLRPGVSCYFVIIKVLIFVLNFIFTTLVRLSKQTKQRVLWLCFFALVFICPWSKEVKELMCCLISLLLFGWIASLVHLRRHHTRSSVTVFVTGRFEQHPGSLPTLHLQGKTELEIYPTNSAIP